MALQSTLALIKPHVCKQGLKSVIKIINRYVNPQDGLKIHEIRYFIMSEDLFEKIYGQHEGKWFYQAMHDCYVGGGFIALWLDGENAVAKVREINGPTDPADAKIKAPDSLRALYGTGTKAPTNAVHGSDSGKSAFYELQMIFANPL